MLEPYAPSRVHARGVGGGGVLNLEHLVKVVFLCWSFLEVYIFATTYRKAFIVGPNVPYTTHPTPSLPYPYPYPTLPHPTLPYPTLSLLTYPSLPTPPLPIPLLPYPTLTPPTLGSAVAWWLMPQTPDPEVGGLSPTRVKPCCVLEQGTFTPQKYR